MVLGWEPSMPCLHADLSTAAITSSCPWALTSTPRGLLGVRHCAECQGSCRDAWALSSRGTHSGIALQPLSQNRVLEPPDQIALLKNSGGIDIGARAALG